MSDQPKDLRPADMKKMGKRLNDLWGQCWEGTEGLHNEMYRSTDSAQNAWHLSRMSFLAGYKAAKNESKPGEIGVAIDNEDYD